MAAGVRALTRTMLGRAFTLPILVLAVSCTSVARPAGSASGPGSASGSASTSGSASGSAPRGPLTLTYLGVAGWQLDGGGHTVLVDPYFSRPDLDRPIASEPAAVAARSPARADLVLVGHTHVDHALDAPAVAARTGAELVGSLSTALYARAAGLADDRIVTVKGGEDYAFAGDLSVRVVPALHSALGDKHVFGSAFTAPPTLPLGFDGFVEGGTFAYLIRLAGQRVFVLGSANFVERELAGLEPDVAIVGTGLRQEIFDYTCRLLHALGDPPLVIANHFDDWRGPPVDAPADEDLTAFVAEVERCAPGTRVVVPRHFAPMIVE
jgi:L-ascorbate metabolism protein UlaG (beta-lactamase superfamily)